jgi:PKD repeat protein
MPEYFINGATGDDRNSGLTETNAWKSLDAASSRLKPGDVLTGMPGTLRGTFKPPSGTAAAPIRFRAKDPLTVTVDGSECIDGLPWQKVTNGWQVPFRPLVFNVFQRTFETDGKLANFNNRDFNQYNSNPQLDLHGTPAEFKWQNATLRLNAIPSTPGAEPLYAATTELALDLNGKSYVIVEGIVTRGHKHAVGTKTGAGIHLVNCRYTFCGSTGVWLVGLTDSEMAGCVIQGAGSWGGHYEDCVHTEQVTSLKITDTEMSYGGHSGLIMLSGVPGARINLARLYFHHMGGSLLTLKRGVDNLLVEDCWFSGAAKSDAVDAHKVPHAGIQLSGKGHVFRNSMFRDNGKDILASSDGNADSNPVCSDILFDHCSLLDSEAGAVEGQEYAPAGRVERLTWQDCIINRDVALFYAGVGDRTSNRLVHCQVTNSTNRGVSLRDCSTGPIPGTGTTLTKPPSGGVTPPPVDPGGNPVPTKPTITNLSPNPAKPGDTETITGTLFGVGALVIMQTKKADGSVSAARVPMRFVSDMLITYVIPAEGASGPVYVRNTQLNLTSDPVTLTVGEGPAPPPTNQPPIANAGGPYTGVVGQPVQFDGSKSIDLDGTIAAWRWDFGDGQVRNATALPQYAYGKAGTYTVTLTVTDDKGGVGTATTTATITAAPQPPPTALQVTITANSTGVGAAFNGLVTANPALPPGTVFAIQISVPDGRVGSAKTELPGVTPPPPEPPPPSGNIAVSDYSPSPVMVGQPLTINGSGFKQTTDILPVVEWEGLDLRLTSVQPTQIKAIAPTEVGSGRITVRQGNDEAAGPILEVKS